MNIPERYKKYRAMIMEDRPLSMGDRFQLYIAGVVIGIFLLLPFSPLLLFFPYIPFIGDNDVLHSAIFVLILTFPSVTLNWLIKNRDTSRQLKDSSNQQNETLFSNALQLLFKENDIIANAIGLKELVKLKQEESIASKRVNLVTSSGLQLEKASLQKASLQGANLQRAKLRSAELQGAELQGASLIGANLIGASLIGANLIGANLIGAELQEAKLQGANLIGANLQGANLQGAGLLVAGLQKADLKIADLQGADLQGAYLQGANLKMANLKMAKLQGANLQGAIFQGTSLKHSRYDEYTIFPDGFDPNQHGMELIQEEDRRESSPDIADKKQE